MQSDPMVVVYEKNRDQSFVELHNEQFGPYMDWENFGCVSV